MTDVTIPQVEGGQTTSPTMGYTAELDSGSTSVYAQLSDVLKLAIPEGQLINGKISPSVSSNNLILAVKTTSGNDPSASDPVLVKISGSIRAITAATSCQLNAATNWFNAGAAELATKEIDYFAYAVWDSNSSVVAIAPARIPYAGLVSDFSATTTNEKHLGNYANYTATDDVCVVGRFAATLSAGAGYTWSVPTFTNANLKQSPTFTTRWLRWQPTYAAGGSMTFTTVTTDIAKYRINYNALDFEMESHGTTGGTASTYISSTLPFSANTDGGAGTPVFTAGVQDTASVIASTGQFNATTLFFFRYDAANWGLGANRYILGSGQYQIS